MATRFALILATILVLVTIGVPTVTPIIDDHSARPQDPSAVAGCYAVQLGAWSSARLLDSLGVVPPREVQLRLTPNSPKGVGRYPHRVLPSGLAGTTEVPTDPGNWGVHYHGGIIAGWSYRSFWLHLYLEPSRGALRGFASLAVRDTGWRYEHAPATLRRVACGRAAA